MTETGTPGAEETPATEVSGARRSRRGPYAKGALRRQQILERALDVFDELGAEATSLRAIGEAIGVNHGTLLHYFSSREELFLEVLRANDRRGLETLFRTDAELTRFVSAMAEHSLRLPGLMALYATMAARAVESGNESSRAFFVERNEMLRQQIVRFLERGRELGSVRTDIPVDAAAAIVLATCDGLSTQWLLDPRTDMREGMRVLERLLAP